MALINIADLETQVAQQSNQQNQPQQTQANPTQYAQQASQMPQGNTIQPTYSPRVAEVNPLLNPQLVAQQQQAEIAGKMQGQPQLDAQEEQAKSNVAAQQKVAEENSTMDAFTNGLRQLTRNYGKAYVNGYAGNSINKVWGTLATNGMIPFSDKHNVGQEGVGAFESLQSSLIPSLNSVYSTNFGGQEPSTRIMASLLELAHKELPTLDKTIPADEGKIQGSLYRFGTVLTGALSYLKNNYNSQQLLQAYKTNPKILDQYAANAMKNASSYQLSPEVQEGLNDRYNSIIQPLEAAKEGKIVYDVPKEGKSYMISRGDADEFEKEKGVR